MSSTSGSGAKFDDEELQAYPPGAVVVLPGGTPHFHWAKSGAYVTQVLAIGPLGLEYLDPTDDRGTSEEVAWGQQGILCDDQLARLWAARAPVRREGFVFLSRRKRR